MSENGFIVDVCSDGIDGLHVVLTVAYDLILLDVMLPGRDGWSIVQKFSPARQQVPVLFLTARDAVEDRVKGLELGADDYLVKPFAFSELLARVRTVLRRGSAHAGRQGGEGEVLQVADLHIDLIRHRTSRGGQRLDLTPKEFLLLALFVRRQGEVLLRTFIAEQVWDMNFDSDTNVVDVHARPAPGQGRRSLREEADSDGSRHGLCSRRRATMRSLAARLTIYYALSSFALVLLATGYLYWVLADQLDRENDRFLAEQALPLVNLLRE